MYMRFHLFGRNVRPVCLCGSFFRPHGRLIYTPVYDILYKSRYISMKQKTRIGIGILVIILAIAVYSFITSFEEPYEFNVSQETITEEENSISVDVSYPVLPSEYEWVNTHIKEIVTQRIDRFKEIAQENRQARIDTDPSYADEEIERGPLYTLSMSYEIDSFDETYFSTLFVIDEYSGGAHGIRVFETVNANLETEEFVTLSDILSYSLEEVSEMVKENVKAQLAERGMGDYESIKDSLWLDEGAAAVEENFSQFTFTDQTVTFYFAPYELGPYALGTFRVEIPRE